MNAARQGSEDDRQGRRPKDTDNMHRLDIRMGVWPSRSDTKPVDTETIAATRGPIDQINETDRVARPSELSRRLGRTGSHEPTKKPAARTEQRDIHVWAFWTNTVN